MKRRYFILWALLAAGSFSLPSCYDPYYTGRFDATTSAYEPGYVVRTLPSGYRTVEIDDTRYYQHDGVYYQPRGTSYVVVEHPEPRQISYRDRDRNPDRYDRRYERGTWSSQPADANSRRFDDRGRDYDRDRGRYDPRHREEVRVLRQLPRNHRVLKYRGQPYYRIGDTYYQEREGVYIPVASPF